MTIDVAGICHSCGKALRPGEPYTYQQITGWVRLGRSRASTHLVNKEPTGKVACRDCGPHKTMPTEKLF